MRFFNSDEPYQIARNMTGNHELSDDLVAHVYMIMLEKKDIENERAMFVTIAHRQWSLKNSEFNQLYRPVHTTEFNGDIHSIDSDTISNDKFKNYLNDYINRQPENIDKWYIREITILWVNGLTYREISKKTKINIRYITEAIKQFKHDVFNSFHSDSNHNDSDELQ